MAIESVHDDVVEMQPFQVKLVGLFVQEDVIVIVCPTCGDVLLAEIEQLGTAGPACVQSTPV